MSTEYVVVVPFDGYTAGTPITDPVVIAAILASPLAGRVVPAADRGPSTPPRPPPALSGDALLELTIGGVARPFTLAELAAFLAAIGGTPAPTTDSTLSLSLDLASGLAVL